MHPTYKRWRSWRDVVQAARRAQQWSWWQSAQLRSFSGTARRSSLCPAGPPKWPWPEQPAGLLHWGGCRAVGKRYWRITYQPGRVLARCCASSALGQTTGCRAGHRWRG